MSIGPGVRIGSCEILESLGAGGMGQVYRAKDTRLNRIVAVKAMHDLFAQHPERVARFEREAQLLASLNHPNIAAIHGVEEAQGSTYLVLEFVDGRPLFEILKTGALPVPEALALAKQIVKIGTPRLLYGGRFRPGLNANSGYDVTKDGRFLRIQQVSPDRPATQLELALNWFGELARAAGK